MACENRQTSTCIDTIHDDVPAVQHTEKIILTHIDILPIALDVCVCVCVCQDREGDGLDYRENNSHTPTHVALWESPCIHIP